jgi:hypothetical protein
MRLIKMQSMLLLLACCGWDAFGQSRRPICPSADSPCMRSPATESVDEISMPGGAGDQLLFVTHSGRWLRPRCAPSGGGIDALQSLDTAG